ncbi:MAG: lytic transglycosylase domain-containing protein [Actinomycetota bacterium]
MTVVAAGAFAVIHLTQPDWYVRWWYPLKHEQVIREQARAYRLDPALVAAIIYEESSFEDGSVSGAGAVGLMQLMPATANWIAEKTGGASVSPEDLKQPGRNIAYGCWYYRYLLDRYGGAEAIALAAYNSGTEAADSWVAEARSSGRVFDYALDIPWQETREFVADIEETKETYRRAYGRELGVVP